jgi:hypothetical protein
LKLIITIARSIRECSSSWDELLPDGHHLRLRHLQAFEEARIDNIENVYLQVFSKDKLIGLVYLQKFLFRHQHLNFSQPATFLSRCLRIILPAKIPLLVCGHLFRVDFQGYYFKDPAPPTLVFEAIRLFLKQNKKYRPYGIIIKDCESVFVNENYRAFGYEFFNGDVTMELNRRPHWLSFDDYLADLNKSYLHRARKIIQASNTIDKKELSAPEILEHSADIERLYWNVVNKQTVKLGTVNIDYFYQLKTDLGQNFEFHTLYQDDVMVGFYTFIFYGRTMETHFIGMDYEANKKFKIYFNILFLSTQKMIERQYVSLELGRTAREAKVNLGARPKQIFNYIKVKNPVVKMTLNYFLRRFNRSASEHLAERNPLK